jgi:hypothetical protein
MRDWGTAAALNAPMGLTFTGPKSMGWNHDAANTATKLLDNGADPAQVWKSHLIGRMPDKSLFSEIDDSGSRYTEKIARHNRLYEAQKNLDDYDIQSQIDLMGAKGDRQDFKLPEVLKHDSFFNQYPDSNNIDFVSDYMGGNTRGSAGGNTIMVDSGLKGMPAKSTTLHELQHAIQEKEGWARGGSPESAMFAMKGKDFNDLKVLLEKKALKEGMDGNSASLTGWKRAQNVAYRRLTGEAQARATQDRMNMGMQQRRDTYPLAGGKLSDIPLDQLINRYR